ncbi:hypothetical protein ACDZ28_10640 [Paenibacillus sp. RS8]|uniref:hypothetical protein n=1 Tax=Paenibacillus sp. RS8 TaxID=3242681 RepID=UPI0035C1713A
MERAQVIELLCIIAEEHSQIDTSEDEEIRLHKSLKDFPFDVACENVRQHMLTNPWPPKIAQIRGGAGDLRDKGLLKDQTSEYFAERDRSRAAAKPVPPGWKEELYARINKGTSAR